MSAFTPNSALTPLRDMLLVATLDDLKRVVNTLITDLREV